MVRLWQLQKNILYQASCFAAIHQKKPGLREIMALYQHHPEEKIKQVQQKIHVTNISIFENLSDSCEFSAKLSQQRVKDWTTVGPKFIFQFTFLAVQKNSRELYDFLSS